MRSLHSSLPPCRSPGPRARPYAAIRARRAGPSPLPPWVCSQLHPGAARDPPGCPARPTPKMLFNFTDTRAPRAAKGRPGELEADPQMERLARITHQELQTSKQSEGKVQSFEGLRQGMSLQSANWRDLPQEGAPDPGGGDEFHPLQGTACAEALRRKRAQNLSKEGTGGTR